MESFLILGLLVGMSHAFETDHLAAIGALASSGGASPKRLALLGASWGMGHATTLLLISLPAILFGAILTDRIAAGLEFGVGIMLIGLGAHVVWKLRRARIHFHLHDHGDGRRHFHAHSHAGARAPHRDNPHDHSHSARFSPRAYLIGLAHGAAGSAGLVALAAAATQNAVTAIAYVLVFGVGSILGMAALTFAASWPLGKAETGAARLFGLLQAGVACVAILVGVAAMVAAYPIIAGLA